MLFEVALHTSVFVFLAMKCVIINVKLRHTWEEADVVPVFEFRRPEPGNSRNSMDYIYKKPITVAARSKA
jgi:hypothetical protein